MLAPWEVFLKNGLFSCTADTGDQKPSWPDGPDSSITGKMEGVMDYITGDGRVDDVLIAVRRPSTQAVYET